MPRTPATLARHELLGLAARVSDAADPGLVGIDGTVVAESTNTVSIEHGGRTWQVPKAGATFAFDLPGDAGASPDAGEPVTVAVDGERLIARPARRTERRGESTWR
ncbi:ribonuclease P protein component 1 [Halorhabdus sp. CBA1104]|uniref:ribonuclease P protein component 1 n=1 Tax=Halorhabdus sp. CBA1104 TaxID=1380432 RepID=UPI0012B4267A|nr:ribonuclease P protein component 1 [Halorhabdus sp. CBA1104]QGN06009.1 ribonuclease P protein component 1 [Halorhabdus sp. CBA1104]